MSKKLYIKTEVKNPEIRAALLKIAKANVKLDPGHVSEEALQKIDYYPCAALDFAGFGFCCKDCDHTNVTLDHFIKELTALNKEPEPVEIALNGDHTAVISHDGSVKVGCQTFSAKKMEKFVSAWLKITTDKASNTNK